MKKVIISPSVLGADFTNFATELNRIREETIEAFAKAKRCD